MSETLAQSDLREQINAYAPYAGARIEITRLDLDGGRIDVRMPLVDENRNLVGTHFGGSLYAMVDPHLMILLMHALGDRYTVWDRAATIEFLQPGTGTVHASIVVTGDELDEIRAATAEGDKYLPEWTLEVLDDRDNVIATVQKTLYVRRKASEAES